MIAPVVSVPGLVRGEHGDPGQALDRLQPLDEHLLAAEPDHRHRLRHAQQQHQTLRHEGDDAGHDAEQRRVHGLLLARPLAEVEQQPRRGRSPR